MKTALLQYITEKKYDNRYSEKLRGYFANLYKEEDLFHNHDEKGKSQYRMPLIQYKVINGMLSIVGIEEGAKLIADEFLKHKRIPLESERGIEYLENFEVNLIVKEEEFCVNDELYSYKFDSIWLALNEENHKKYIKEESIDLDKILIGNILSNFKGCDIKIEKKIMVKGNYKPIEVMMKNNKMIGFTGNFVTNVKMPDYISIGKRRAIGYGVVKSV